MSEKLLFSNLLLGAVKQERAIPVIAKLQLSLADIKLRLQNRFLNFLRQILFGKIPDSPDRILIFRTGSLGDSICSIPAIRAIVERWPDARIDILTNAGQKNLVGLQSLLLPSEYHEVIDYQGKSKKQLFKELRARKYSMVLQLPQVDISMINLLRDMLIFRLITPRGFGWHLSQTKWFKRKQAKYLIYPNEVSRLNWLVNKMGIWVDAQANILHPEPNDLQLVKRKLDGVGLVKHEKILAVVVGAKRPQNRWPISHFKVVVNYFADKYDIVLIGSHEDKILAEPLSKIPGVIDMCGELTPLQSAALISLSKLVISNDTGPMHLSYGVGTPTIALFSSRDLPGKWYPHGQTHVVFRTKDVHCQACFSETCADNICMQAIKPTSIIEKAELMLKMNLSN